MKLSKFCAHISTLGPIGYLVAPGTVASLVTLPLVFWLQRLAPSPLAYGLILLAGFCAAIIIINKALHHFKRYDDPSEIVLDEVIGCLLTFWGIAFSVQHVIVGFILFRFFDILKIGGIKYVQRLIDAWGIVLDDIFAAIIVNIILRLIF